MSHLSWLCRLVSPFASRADVADAMPRRIDWPTLVDMASWNGLLVSVYPALEERGLCDAAPADALDALREFHAQARQRRAEAAAQVARASGALNAAGIEPLWLKGAALLIEGSPWAERRWMSDIDVWVAPRSLDAAQSALLALGYRYDARQPHASEHHLRPLFHPEESFALELHHALVPPSVAGLMPIDRVMANAKRIEWRGMRVAIPGALDQAVHIASQARPSASTHLRGRLKTRRVVEFAQLASSAGAAEASHALRAACAEAGQDDFGHEVLALAGGLCELPGAPDARGAMAGLAWKTAFPRWHSLYFGFRGLAGQGIARHAANPRLFARTLAAHLRRSMDTRW